MTPADIWAIDPYILAALDGNTIVLMLAYAIVKTGVAMSKKTEGANIWEWILALLGSVVNFRKNGNGGKNDRKNDT